MECPPGRWPGSADRSQLEIGVHDGGLLGAHVPVFDIGIDIDAVAMKKVLRHDAGGQGRGRGVAHRLPLQIDGTRQATVPARHEYSLEVMRLSGHGDDVVADLHGLQGLPGIGQEEVGLAALVLFLEVGVIPRCLHDQAGSRQLAVQIIDEGLIGLNEFGGIMQGVDSQMIDGQTLGWRPGSQPRPFLGFPAATGECSQ